MGDLGGYSDRASAPSSRNWFSSPKAIAVEADSLCSVNEQFLIHSPSRPFDTAGKYYPASMEQKMALIADGQLFTSIPVNVYLVLSFLKSQVQALAAGPQEIMEQFYLEHVDDTGDQLMVNEALNATGIMDWQMARVVPAREAFWFVSSDSGNERYFRWHAVLVCP